MGTASLLAHRIEFSPENSEALLREIPAVPGVMALRGADPASEPYLTRTADLRRRVRRLLAPPEALNEDGTPVLSKRLNLRERVRWIEYTRTGSDFESTLVLYRASRSAFGAEEARRRLRLYAPAFLRVTMENAYPRVYATNRLSKKALAESLGPFPSRAAAERYCDAVLDLFQIRRCHEELEPYPEHPGCVYGEMKKCMAPCKAGAMQGGTREELDARYAEEAQRVFAFFKTRGRSMLDEIAAEREAASEAMNFEQAAALHKQWEKVRAAALLADELIRPVSDLRAIVIQEAAPIEPATEPGAPSIPTASPSGWVGSHDAESAALFLLSHGRIAGPELLSTLGVRAVREQTAVGSSLFAQPLMLAPVPLETSPVPSNNVISTEAHASNSVISTDAQRSGEIPALSSAQILTGPTILTPEDRARAAIAALESQIETVPEIAEVCDFLSLFRRWYYRPEKQRTGEVLLPNTEEAWSVRRLLNAAARVVLGPPAAAPPVDREAAKQLKTKILHEGREGVEREVPALPKRKRSRKAVTPADLAN
jgi:excinuclease ABC subunit C